MKDNLPFIPTSVSFIAKPAIASPYPGRRRRSSPPHLLHLLLHPPPFYHWQSSHPTTVCSPSRPLQRRGGVHDLNQTQNGAATTPRSPPDSSQCHLLWVLRHSSCCRNSRVAMVTPTVRGAASRSTCSARRARTRRARATARPMIRQKRRCVAPPSRLAVLGATVDVGAGAQRTGHRAGSSDGVCAGHRLGLHHRLLRAPLERDGPY